MARVNLIHNITDDSAIGGQVIQGSTIFDSTNASHLKRTPSSAGNRRTFTISLWTRRTPNGGGAMFGAYISDSDRAVLRFASGDVIEFQTSGYSVKTSSTFRGFNGWYHIVAAIDTTDGTQSNRGKIYVNGVQQTLQSNNLNQNVDTSVNNNTIHVFGTRILSSGTNSNYDGQLAQINLIDGQQLDASYFGYFDFQTGIWRPKKYTGTYGTNGVYLPLDGLQHISRDLSGNGNHFTPSDISGTVPLSMATGAFPILKTNSGGTTACPSVRPDPFASNIVLALPLSDRSATAIGVDVHHLIKGSGSPKTLTNTGSIANNITQPHFYGRSGAVDLADMYTDRIEISASDDFNMGTGDFTVECWIHPRSTSAVDASLFVTHDGSTYFAFNFDPGGEFNIYLSASAVALTAAEGLIEYNKWNHVALVRYGNVVKVYVNGLAIGSINHTGSVGYSAASTTLCRIGGAGGSTAGALYMQDFRIYKGVAKYTDTFTCGSQNSAVLPDSPSGVAVSRKFKPTISGSVGFEGTNSKLVAPHHTDLNATNQDFCFEAFIYPVGSTSNFGFVFAKGVAVQIAWVDSSAVSRMTCYLSNNGSDYNIANDFNSGTGSVPMHQWSHFAFVRSSGTLKWYINGIEKASTSISGTIHANTDDFNVGAYSSTSYEFKGSISNARVTIGQAVYTSNFTTPTEPLTLTSQSVTSSNVKLLCCKDKFDESAVDKIPTGSLTVHNSAKATSFSPFLDDVDSRAGGYPTLNEHLNRKAGTVYEGNLRLMGNNYTLQKSTVVFGPGHITTGKYFWEIENGGGGSSAMYTGITGEFDQSAGEIALQANKSFLGSTYYKLYNQTNGTSMTNLEAGTISFALDVDNRVLRAYYNTKLIYTDTTIPNASTTQYAPFTFSTNDGASGVNHLDAFYNLGQRPFTFTPPEGYESLGSANISPTPVKITKPEKHFACLKYTGDGSSNNRVTGLQFKPDFIWIKSISASTDNIVQDSVRGNFILYPNTTAPDGATGGGWVKSFNPDGFTTDVNGPINTNSATYSAWCWKAGGNSNTFNVDGVGYASASAAGITDGTVPLTGASVNKKAGFSIVTYDGNSTGTTTFGHGLNQAPEIFFLKSRDATEEWRVYYTIADGSYDFMYLNTTDDVFHSGYALPTSTVINKADANGESMVAYIWHSVPGYSKMGSYYGNGSSDGKFVYTGFRPAFILLKRHTDGANYWEIRDNKRNPNNPADSRLFPNNTDSQSVGEGMDFYNNGFKIKNNGSGSNSGDKLYIYMAFAEQPAVNQYGAQSNGR